VSLPQARDRLLLVVAYQSAGTISRGLTPLSCPPAADPRNLATFPLAVQPSTRSSARQGCVGLWDPPPWWLGIHLQSATSLRLPPSGLVLLLLDALTLLAPALWCWTQLLSLYASIRVTCNYILCAGNAPSLGCLVSACFAGAA